jgi:CRISPR-associated protein Cas1
MSAPTTVDLGQLSRVTDRSSFLYVERSEIHREANAVTSTDAHGVIAGPGAGLAALLLGPGCSITHSAVSLLAENGMSIVWVSESGVR